MLIDKIRKLTSYLLGKKSELQDLDVKDALLAKVILDIHRCRTHSEFVLVPLFSLGQIHAIDRDNAIAATRKRVDTLRAVADELKTRKIMTREVLGEYLPSISWIKVVREDEHSYIAYEGNGRLVAMQDVFSPADGIMVEVEQYHFKKPKKILRRMNRVRRLNGLLQPGTSDCKGCERAEAQERRVPAINTGTGDNAGRD